MNSPEVVDIAPQGKARQSTLSSFSLPDGAQAAIRGSRTIEGYFAVHTLNESHPWWSVDLRRRLPIWSIKVHSRRDRPPVDGSRFLTVETSADGERWTTIHTGMTYFGGRHDGRPLTLELAGRVIARHIRLSLPGQDSLVIDKVETFVERAALDLHRAWEKLGLSPRFLHRRSDRLNYHPPYTLVPGTGGSSDRITGLRVRRFGRFGNNLLQLSFAIHVARSLGLEYVQTMDFELFHLSQPVTIEGITLLPPAAEVPPNQCFIAGPFFYGEHFGDRLSQGMTAPVRYEIVRQYIRPYLNPGTADETRSPDELLIHIRSGDVFGSNVNPHYAQPPLSFYVGVIRSAMSDGSVGRVRLVCEDRLNPCIDALEDFLRANGIPHRVQIGTVEEDVAVLAAGRRLVFGIGTFGLGICLVADHTIAAMYVFGRDHDQDLLNGQTYATLPNVDRVTIVTDAKGDYIGPEDWRNTPEQRELMLTYPLKNLRFATLKGGDTGRPVTPGVRPRVASWRSSRGGKLGKRPFTGRRGSS